MNADPTTLGLGIWALVLAVIDSWRQRIPNALLLLALVPAVLVVAVDGWGFLGAGPLSSAGGFAVGGLIVLPGYLLGKMGAGDVKLAAVLGLLSGFPAVLWWLLYAALALGVMSLIAVSLRWAFATRWKKIPAAVSLVVGFLGWLFWGRLLAGAV